MNDFEERVRTRAYFRAQNTGCHDSDYNYKIALEEEIRQDQIRSQNPICVVCAGNDNDSDWQQLICEHYMHVLCRLASRAYCPECLKNWKVNAVQEQMDDEEKQYFSNDDEEDLLSFKLPVPNETNSVEAEHGSTAESEDTSSSSSIEDMPDLEENSSSNEEESESS